MPKIKNLNLEKAWRSWKQSSSIWSSLSSRPLEILFQQVKDPNFFSKYSSLMQMKDFAV